MKKFSTIKKIYEQELALPKGENENDVNIGKTVEAEAETKTKPEIGEITKSEPAKFFSKIFEARQMAHIYHLQVKGDTGSHAAHIALNDYYDSLLELLDNLIETYQGQYDIIENYELIDTKDSLTKDKLSYFIDVNKFISDTRNKVFLSEDTHLHNIVDEIVALTYKLIYKLKFNK